MKFTWDKGQWVEGQRVSGSWKQYPVEVCCLLLFLGGLALHFGLPWILKGVRVWLAF